MSQSESAAGSGQVSRAHLDLSLMMKRGRSWSGRERHCAFLNLGPGEGGRPRRFANISALSGIDLPDDGRAICLADWDHDGDIDLWISNRSAPQLRLFRNRGTGGNHFLALKLTAGSEGGINRDAIGARVSVRPVGGGRPLIKTLRAGDGFLAQSSKWLLFGLGEAGAAARVEIRWPGGATETFDDVPGDRHYQIHQGGGPPRIWNRPKANTGLSPSPPAPPPTSRRARIPLVTQVKLPALDYAMFSGRSRPLKPGAPGRSLLVNLWASWCAPCQVELKAFKARSPDLRSAGVDVVALAVDGIGDDTTDPAAAPALAGRLALPFPAGRASEQILTILERLHVRLTPMELDLVVPLSLLVDPQGRAAVIYKGPVGVDQIIADLDHSKKSRPDRLLATAPAGLGGTALESGHATIAAAADNLELSQRFQFAQDMWQARLLDDAAAQFEDVLRLDPGFAAAANNLGLVYATQGKLRQAEATYRQALASSGAKAVTHFNLGLSLEKLGRAGEAEASYRRALQLDPGLVKVHDALGMLEAKRGRFAAAKAHFQRETEVNPGFAEGHNHLGLIHLSLDAPAEAVGPLTRAIELAPRHADALNNLGVARRRLGDLDAAADAFRRAVEAAPSFVPALVNLGLVHLGRGERDAAIQCFQGALALEPNSPIARRNLAKARALPPGP